MSPLKNFFMIKKKFNSLYIICVIVFVSGEGGEGLKSIFKFPIEDFETSITSFSFFINKVKYLGHLLINQPNLFSESSYGIL